MEKKTANNELTVKAFFEKIKALGDLEDIIYQIDMTNKFKKSIDLSYSRKLNLELLLNVIELLAKGEQLPQNYHAHELKGQYKGVMECHVKSDWILMWKMDKKELILLLLNTSTHSDIFGKNVK